MSRSGTSAELFVDDMPQIGEGVRRYVVDCKWAETKLLYCPGGELELTEGHLTPRHVSGPTYLHSAWQEKPLPGPVAQSCRGVIQPDFPANPTAGRRSQSYGEVCTGLTWWPSRSEPQPRSIGGWQP